MNIEKHYRRLIKFMPDAPIYAVKPDSKYIVISDIHMGKQDGADDFYQNLPMTAVLFIKLVNEGFKFIPDGDIWELLECDAADVFDHYKSLLELIYSNLATCQTPRGSKHGIGYCNHDAELPKILGKGAIGEWFKKLVPNPCFWRVSKLSTNAYITHGDLGDFFNDDAHWAFTKWIVRNVWARWQRWHGRPDITSPAKNKDRASDMELGYRYAISQLGNIGIYGHTHEAKQEGFYINIGTSNTVGYITYGLIYDCKFHLMRTNDMGTTCLKVITLI